MITIYLDHMVIDGFDKGETAYLAPLFANKGVLPIISLASVDEIFRGRDEARSRRNIETLKQLGVRYIHAEPDDDLHMSIIELDYDKLHKKWSQKWLEMQTDIGPLNESYVLFINALFRGNLLEAIQDMDQAVNDEIAWMNRNYAKAKSIHTQIDEILSNPEDYKDRCKELLHLKELLPFTSMEINNIP